MNILIEFDGLQHFHIYNGIFAQKLTEEQSEVKLLSQQKRDGIKTNFAKASHIKLIRIKYTEINKIEEILKEELCHL